MTDREYIRANRNRVNIGTTETGQVFLETDEFEVHDALEDYLTEARGLDFSVAHVRLPEGGERYRLVVDGAVHSMESLRELLDAL